MHANTAIPADRAIASSISMWSSSQQAAGVQGAGILPATRDGNSNPLARSGGESGELLEACTKKHHGDAGGILPSLLWHLLCVLMPARESLCSHLPDMCILLMFWCCSSHLLKLEQETAGVVPWLQLDRSCSWTRSPLVLQKKMEDLPSISSKEQKTVLGCSRVLACAVSAKSSGI